MLLTEQGKSFLRCFRKNPRDIILGKHTVPVGFGKFQTSLFLKPAKSRVLPKLPNVTSILYAGMGSVPSIRGYFAPCYEGISRYKRPKKLNTMVIHPITILSNSFNYEIIAFIELISILTRKEAPGV